MAPNQRDDEELATAEEEVEATTTTTTTAIINSDNNDNEREDEDEEDSSSPPAPLDDNDANAPPSAVVATHNALLPPIFLILGIGTLVPWNAFISAKAYFDKRLCDTDTSTSVANANIEQVFASVYNLSSVGCLALMLGTSWFKDHWESMKRKTQMMLELIGDVGGCQCKPPPPASADMNISTSDLHFDPSEYDENHLNEIQHLVEMKGPPTTKVGNYSSARKNGMDDDDDDEEEDDGGNAYRMVMIPVAFNMSLFIAQTVMVAVTTFPSQLFELFLFGCLFLLGIGVAVSTAGIVATAGMFPPHITMSPYVAGQAVGGVLISVANFLAAIGGESDAFYETYCEAPHHHVHASSSSFSEQTNKEAAAAAANNNDQDIFVPAAAAEDGASRRYRYLLEEYADNPSSSTTMSPAVASDEDEFSFSHPVCVPYRELDYAVMCYFLLGSVILFACLVGYAYVDSFKRRRLHQEHEMFHHPSHENFETLFEDEHEEEDEDEEDISSHADDASSKGSNSSAAKHHHHKGTTGDAVTASTSSSSSGGAAAAAAAAVRGAVAADATNNDLNADSGGDAAAVAGEQQLLVGGSANYGATTTTNYHEEDDEWCDLIEHHHDEQNVFLPSKRFSLGLVDALPPSEVHGRIVTPDEILGEEEEEDNRGLWIDLLPVAVTAHTVTKTVTQATKQTLVTLEVTTAKIVEAVQNPDNETSAVFSQISGPTFCICFSFFITLCLFPGWTSELRSVHECEPDSSRFFNDLFTPFSFVLFNVGDLSGRTIAGFVPISKFTNLPTKLVLLAILRGISFYVLFFFCHGGPRGEDRLHGFSNYEIQSDVYTISVQYLFGVTFGLLVSMAFATAPGLIPQKSHTQERMSKILTFALSFGLLSGSFFSFVTAKIMGLS